MLDIDGATYEPKLDRMERRADADYFHRYFTAPAENAEALIPARGTKMDEDQDGLGPVLVAALPEAKRGTSDAYLHLIFRQVRTHDWS